MPDSTYAMRQVRAALLVCSLAILQAELHAADETAESEFKVNSVIAQQMSQAELSMQFTGKTAEDFRHWKDQFAAKLLELLGDHDPPDEWSVQEESRTEQADHMRFELLLVADGVPSVPIYLLVPHDLSEEERAPAVLCIHGHGRHGHHPVVGRRDLDKVGRAIDRANYDYGLQFVKRGYVVAAPCLIPFGRRVDRDEYDEDDPCAVTFVRMQALG